MVIMALVLALVATTGVLAVGCGTGEETGAETGADKAGLQAAKLIGAGASFPRMDGGGPDVAQSC